MYVVADFQLPFFNKILLLAYEDASLLKHYHSTFKNCSMQFSAQLLLLDMIFLTLSRKPGKNLVIVLSFVYIFYDLSLSTRLTKLLRFKLNQITRKRSGRTRLTMLYQTKPNQTTFCSKSGETLNSVKKTSSVLFHVLQKQLRLPSIIPCFIFRTFIQ